MKWVGTRAETFVSDYHGRAARLIGELALDRDGVFLALRLQWIVNAGAYLSTPVRSSTRCCRASTPATCTAFRRCTAATSWS